MSVQDNRVARGAGASARTLLDPKPDPDLAEVRRTLTQLEHAVSRLQSHHAKTLGVRRLSSDVRRLLDDLDEIGELAPADGAELAQTHYVPDAPYPPDLWRDCDDEGLDGTAR